MTRHMARQGDLLFLAIDHLPEGLTLQADNIIVRGEATGHAHQLQAGRVFLDVQETRFLEVLTSTQVIRQREYTPEAIRTVMD